MGLVNIDVMLVCVNVVFNEVGCWLVKRLCVIVLMVCGMFVIGILMWVMVLLEFIVNFMLFVLWIFDGGSELMLCGELGVLVLLVVIMVSVLLGSMESVSLLFCSVNWVVFVVVILLLIGFV